MEDTVNKLSKIAGNLLFLLKDSCPYEQVLEICKDVSFVCDAMRKDDDDTRAVNVEELLRVTLPRIVEALFRRESSRYSYYFYFYLV